MEEFHQLQEFRNPLEHHLRYQVHNLHPAAYHNRDTRRNRRDSQEEHRPTGKLRTNNPDFTTATSIIRAATSFHHQVENNPRSTNKRRAINQRDFLASSHRQILGDLKDVRLARKISQDHHHATIHRTQHSQRVLHRRQVQISLRRARERVVTEEHLREIHLDESIDTEETTILRMGAAGVPIPIRHPETIRRETKLAEIRIHHHQEAEEATTLHRGAAEAEIATLHQEEEEEGDPEDHPMGILLTTTMMMEEETREEHHPLHEIRATREIVVPTVQTAVHHQILIHLMILA